MAANGSKVSQKQFYDELRAVELRLGEKIDGVLAAVHENRTITATSLATLSQADEDMCRRIGRIDGEGGSIAGLHAEVDNLKASDKRWGGTAMILTAIGSILAAIFGKS